MNTPPANVNLDPEYCLHMNLVREPLIRHSVFATADEGE